MARLSSLVVSAAIVLASSSASADDEIAIARFNAYGTYAVAVGPKGEVIVSGSADTLNDRRPFVIHPDNRVTRVDTPPRSAVFDIAFSDDGTTRWLGVGGGEGESSHVTCARDGRATRFPFLYPNRIAVGDRGEAIVSSELSIELLDCEKGPIGKLSAPRAHRFRNVDWREGRAVGFLTADDGWRPSFFDATWGGREGRAEVEPFETALPPRFGDTPYLDREDSAKHHPTVTRDGAGGAWAVAGPELVHWRMDGTVERLPPHVARAFGDASKVRALAFDPVRKKIIAAAAPPNAALPNELVIVDAGAVSRTPLAWPKNVRRARHLRLAGRDGVVAIAVDGALVRSRGAERTTFYDAEDRKDDEREEARESSETLGVVTAVGLGAAAGLASGAAIAAVPYSPRYQRTFAETTAGSAAGAFGNVILLAAGDGLINHESGPLGKAIGSTFFLLGALIGPPLTAVGSYATSEWAYRGNPDADYGTALGGAYVGAAIALVSHVVIGRLTRSSGVRTFSLAMSTAFIGGMSSWAIHDAGNGAF